MNFQRKTTEFVTKTKIVKFQSFFQVEHQFLKANGKFRDFL